MSDPKKTGASKALMVSPGYEVGYARPPVATRFKPGQSGNPGGRPKGAKNRLPAFHEERMKQIILDEAYRTITVRDGDRNVSVPMAQAIIRSLAVNAAKGQHRAQSLFADLPPPQPHPDHLLVDVRKGTVRIAGPATKEEKAEWDAILSEKAVLEDRVAKLIEANETGIDPDDIKDNLRYIEIGEQTLASVRKIMSP